MIARRTWKRGSGRPVPPARDFVHPSSAASTVHALASRTVKSVHKFSDASGGFPTGMLDDDDLFGFSVASLGDPVGDGVNDLVAGAPADARLGKCADVGATRTRPRRSGRFLGG